MREPDSACTASPTHLCSVEPSSGLTSTKLRTRTLLLPASQGHARKGKERWGGRSRTLCLDSSLQFLGARNTPECHHRWISFILNDVPLPASYLHCKGMEGEEGRGRSAEEQQFQGKEERGSTAPWTLCGESSQGDTSQGHATGQTSLRSGQWAVGFLPRCFRLRSAQCSHSPPAKQRGACEGGEEKERNRNRCAWCCSEEEIQTGRTFLDSALHAPQRLGGGHLSSTPYGPAAMAVIVQPASKCSAVKPVGCFSSIREAPKAYSFYNRALSLPVKGMQKGGREGKRRWTGISCCPENTDRAHPYPLMPARIKTRGMTHRGL